MVWSENIVISYNTLLIRRLVIHIGAMNSAVFIEIGYTYSFHWEGWLFSYSVTIFILASTFSTRLTVLHLCWVLPFLPRTLTHN